MSHIRSTWWRDCIVHLAYWAALLPGIYRTCRRQWYVLHLHPAETSCNMLLSVLTVFPMQILCRNRHAQGLNSAVSRWIPDPAPLSWDPACLSRYWWHWIDRQAIFIRHVRRLTQLGWINVVHYTEWVDLLKDCTPKARIWGIERSSQHARRSEQTRLFCPAW